MTLARVLVVEDEEDYLNLLAFHLRRSDYEVQTAKNGRQAMAYFEAGEAFDVLVTDLMMPEMDGIELLREARKRDPLMQAVVISGIGTLESAISSMRQGGAFDYLPKPLESIQDLSLAVERAAQYRTLLSDRERLQVQISAERERLQAVVENTGDAILAADGYGRINVANPAALALFELEDPSGMEAASLLPPPVSAVLRNWLAFEAEDRVITEIAWPRGSVQMVSLMPIENGSDLPSKGWVMVVRDITQQKRLNELKMRLLTRSADKMRKPLARAVETLVELNELPEAKTEDFTGSVETMMNQLSTIRAWTDDLFDLVQAEAGEGVAYSSVNMADLARETEEFLRDGLVRKKGLSLVLSADSAQSIEADAKLSRRLLQQLVRQAAWRAPRGSELTIRIQDRQGQIWLEVRDNGTRILEDETPCRFEKLFAASNEMMGATGLELAVAKTISDRLGGHMWVSSHSPQGNTFAVCFPVGAGPNGAAREV